MGAKAIKLGSWDKHGTDMFAVCNVRVVLSTANLLAAAYLKCLLIQIKAFIIFLHEINVIIIFF